jgi:hypothetical protein
MSLNETIVEEAALEWFHLRPALRDYGGQVGEPRGSVSPMSGNY